MGQAKQKMSVAQNGRQSVTSSDLIGASKDAPPTSNTGGKESKIVSAESSQLVTDRQRVNITVPDGVYSALVGISEKSGVSVSQAALLCLLAGLPALAGQIQSIELLKK